jgi:hypothetical protein
MMKRFYDVPWRRPRPLEEKSWFRYGNAIPPLVYNPEAT